MKAIFTIEKATKNTIRFAEVLESEFAAPKLGSIYIPKATLSEIGWKEGKQVELEISIKE